MLGKKILTLLIQALIGWALIFRRRLSRLLHALSLYAIPAHGADLRWIRDGRRLLRRRPADQ